MNLDKMTSDVLRRRDEIRRQRRRDALKLCASMCITWVIGAFIGTGIYTAFLKEDTVQTPPTTENITVDKPVNTEDEEENVILSHEPLGDFNFLALPEGYTSSWGVDEEKLGGKKSIVIGDEELKLYYNYSVDIKKE